MARKPGQAATNINVVVAPFHKGANGAACVAYTHDPPRPLQLSGSTCVEQLKTVGEKQGAARRTQFVPGTRAYCPRIMLQVNPPQRPAKQSSYMIIYNCGQVPHEEQPLRGR
jgi:hypothetical protein